MEERWPHDGPLTGDAVLCSWERHFTLTVPLSTQVYKWVPVNCYGKPNKLRGVTSDGLAFRPGGVEILLAASCYRNWDKLRPDEPVWLQGFTHKTSRCCCEQWHKLIKTRSKNCGKQGENFHVNAQCKFNVKHKECLRDYPSQRLMIKCLTIIWIELEFENVGFWGCTFFMQAQIKNMIFVSILVKICLNPYIPGP